MYFSTNSSLLPLVLCTLLISFVSCSIDPATCELYKLVEEKVGCGPTGYPLMYGFRNCLVFTDENIREQYSLAGREFLDCSTNCLISAMLNISESATSCSQLHEEAFQSHVDCYLNCDFCEVCKTEKIAFLKSFDWTDFLSVSASQQMFSIFSKCGLFTCFPNFGRYFG